jgi:ABC-type transporter Mla MlaB component
MLGELKKSSGMILDLSGINEADTAAFQLILFLRREAEATERSFIIEKMSSRLEAVFDLYKERV